MDTVKQWRVWNRHPDGLTHKEKFKDQVLEIKAGQYILMDYEDATLFRGQYFPYRLNDFGVQDPKSMKVIEIEPHDGDASPPITEAFISPLDGKRFATKEALMAHEAKLAQENSGLLVKDEKLDQELEKKKKAKT